MSDLREPQPARLFISLIYNENAPVDECVGSLGERFGEVDFISEKFAFDLTSYYEKEMGKGLQREIVSFKKLVKRDELADIKVFTAGLERRFSAEGGRNINIDPGYIAGEHLILATGKGYYHRPYLGRGVYADLTLVYRNKEFQCMEWTYPDYGSEDMRKLFKTLREKYIIDLGERANK